MEVPKGKHSTATPNEISAARSLSGLQFNPLSATHADASQERVLPWEITDNQFTSLYKVAPPKLSYPAGSRDEDVNRRFVTQMDMYLHQNYLVRSVLIGETPHPFSNYPRMQQYWSAIGKPNWKFDPTTTFMTLEEIEANTNIIYKHTTNHM